MPFLPKRAQLSPLGPGPGHGFFTPEVASGGGFGARLGLGIATTWE